MGARVVRVGLPGEGRDPVELRREADRRGLDYVDEMLGPGTQRSVMDPVSRGVALAGGPAVYMEHPRPAWSRPRGRLDGEIPGEPVKFDRMYKVGGVELYVDLVKGDAVDAWQHGRDTGWAEQKERGDLCRAAGCAYLFVDASLPDDEIAEGVRSAVKMLKK